MSDVLVKMLRGRCNCNMPSSPCGSEDECRFDFQVADRIEELEANINLKADFIDATLNQLAAADERIEELEAELNLMKTSGIVEVSVRNPSVMEYMKHWEGRAETAEAKLAKAVEALGNVVGEYDLFRKDEYERGLSPLDDEIHEARTALAELKGQTDE